MGRRRGTLIALRYIHAYRDRHGTLKHYLRRPGLPRVRLLGKPGSPEFMAAYNAAVAEPTPKPPIGAGRHAPQSVAHWVSLYLASQAFAALSPDTRRTRRNLLERFRVKNGDKHATTLTRERIEQMIGQLSPVVARNFLKALRPWLKWCAAQGLRPDNPARDIEKPAYKSTGYKTWPEEYVEQYRAHHPVGTKARRTLELLVNVGAARVDTALLGRQHARNGLLVYRRHKTGVLVEIPILPGLQAVIDEMEGSGDLAFIATEQGKPYTKESFGNMFRAWCDEALIPKGYSAHGIRKYAATLRANLGATAHELMAWFGWLTIREAEEYTREAARRQLAINMAKRLGR